MTTLITSNQFTDNLHTIIDDQSVVSRYKTLAQYCKQQSIPFTLEIKKRIRKALDDTITSQVKELVFTQYFYIEATNSWGNAGEQQVMVSFLRKILNLDRSEPITSDHQNQFQEALQQAKEQYDLVGANVPLLKTKYSNFTINIGHQSFRIHQVKEINVLLAFLHSELYFYTTRFGEDVVTILSKFTHKQIDTNDVYYLTEEVARSPKAIMALAASNTNTNIYLRKESLETIFYQKWVQAFRLSSSEASSIQYIDERNISEGIKKKAFQHYNLHSEDDLKAAEASFVNDMKETILYHELGHIVSLKEILPFEIGAVSEASRILGDNVLSTLFEFLADFCPAYGTQKGAMQNMVEVSKSDPDRAAAMFYMYFSDVWFFDTEDTYMYPYSELMCLLLLKYVLPNNSIDWKTLEKDLRFDKNAYKSSAKSMVERVMNLYETKANEFKGLIENDAYFFGDDNARSYSILKSMTQKKLSESTIIDENDYAYLSKYWSYIVHFCTHFSKDKGEKLRKFLEKEEKLTLKRLFILSAGKKKAETYGFNQRAYIIDRCKELGLTLYNEDEIFDL